MSEPPLVATRELTRVYAAGDTERRALHDVSVDIPGGEITVLSGGPGSGKSTLINVLGGLLAPTLGTVLFRGAPINHADEAALVAYRRNSVGFVFNAFSLVPNLSARENVALVEQLAQDPMSTEEALDIVGLGRRSELPTADLTQGEQQLAVLARAIVKRPALLLCDEPTAELDAGAAAAFWQALLRVSDTAALGSLGVVIASFRPDVAEFGDGVIGLANGRVVRDDRKRAALNQKMPVRDHRLV